MVPFFLVTLGAIWDLREYISQRTDLIRETYLAAEAMADQFADNTPPFAAVLGPNSVPPGPLGTRLRAASVAGSASAALVVRGTTLRDGTPCTNGTWCPPTVARSWPATEAERIWDDGSATGCSAPNALPAVGTTFAATATVLPGEDAGGSPEAAWFSRNMSDEEWWVVIDVCIHPRPGLFTGPLTNFVVRALDLSFPISRRIAWPSVHDRADCNWC